jgi:hypothetical protein
MYPPRVLYRFRTLGCRRRYKQLPRRALENIRPAYYQVRSDSAKRFIERGEQRRCPLKPAPGGRGAARKALAETP